MDSALAFERKTRAMFGRVQQRFEEIAFRYVVNITEALLEYTPGFGNQDPASTLYVPTGRLRGGYSYSSVKLSTASKYEDGPFSDYGDDVVERIESDMRAAGAKSFYIVNDVAYAYIVRRGLGRHERPRNFNGAAATPTAQKDALARALASMGPA